MAPDEAARIARKVAEEARLKAIEDRQEYSENRLQEQINHCAAVHVGMDKVVAQDKEILLMVEKMNRSTEKAILSLERTTSLKFQEVFNKQRLVLWFLAAVTGAFLLAALEAAFDFIPARQPTAIHKHEKDKPPGMPKNHVAKNHKHEQQR